MEKLNFKQDCPETGLDTSVVSNHCISLTPTTGTNFNRPCSDNVIISTGGVAQPPSAESSRHQPPSAESSRFINTDELLQEIGGPTQFKSCVPQSFLSTLDNPDFVLEAIAMKRCAQCTLALRGGSPCCNHMQGEYVHFVETQAVEGQICGCLNCFTSYDGIMVKDNEQFTIIKQPCNMREVMFMNFAIENVEDEFHMFNWRKSSRTRGIGENIERIADSTTMAKEAFVKTAGNIDETFKGFRTDVNDLIPKLTESIKKQLALVGKVSLAAVAVVVIAILGKFTYDKLLQSDRQGRIKIYKCLAGIVTLLGIGSAVYAKFGSALSRWIVESLYKGSDDAYELPVTESFEDDQRPADPDREVDSDYEYSTTVDYGSLPIDSEHKHADEFNGKDELNSFLALIVCVAKYANNPDADFYETFKDLRKESDKFKVAIAGSNFLSFLIPEALRASAYAHFGIGEPEGISPAHKAIVSHAYKQYTLVKRTQFVTPELKSSFLHSYDEVRDMVSSLAFINSGKCFGQSLGTQVVKLMGEVMDKVQSASDVNGRRLRTTGLWLYGMTGTGKSRAIDTIAKSIWSNVPLERRQVSPNLTAGFLSAYKGHAVVDLDDLGSNVDALRKGGFFQQMLTWMSDKPTTVDLAFTKGVNWTTQLLAVTSNRSPDKILSTAGTGQALTNPEAVLRRFTGRSGLRVRVEIKDAYLLNGVVNQAKVDEMKNSDTYPHLRFFLHTSAKMKSKEGRYITWPRLVSMVAENHIIALKQYMKDKQTPGYIVSDNLTERLKEARKNADVFLPKTENNDKNQPSLLEQIFTRGDEFHGMKDAFKSKKKKKRSNSKESKREHYLKRRAKVRHTEYADSAIVSDSESEKSYSEIVSKSIEVEKSSSSFPSCSEPKEQLDKFHADNGEDLVKEEEESLFDHDRAHFEYLMEDARSMSGDGSFHIRRDSQIPWFKKACKSFDDACARASKVNWVAVAQVLAAIGVFIGIGVAFKRLLSDDDDYEDWQHSSDKGEAPVARHWHSRRQGHRYKGGHNRDKRRGFFFSAAEREEPFANFYYTNHGRVCRGMEYSDSSGGYVTMLVGTKVLLNRHYLADSSTEDKLAPEGTWFSFMVRNIEHNVRFYRKDMVEIMASHGHTDFLIWQLPSIRGRAMTHAPSIVKHFVQALNVKSSYYTRDTASSSERVYLTYFQDRDIRRIPLAKAVKTDSKTAKWSFASDPDLASDACLEYKFNSQPGDCGKWVTNGTNILAVHLAGRNNGHGLGELITRECIKAHIEKLDVQISECDQFHCLPQIDNTVWDQLPPGSRFSHFANDFCLPEEGAFYLVGSVRKPVKVSTTTRLVDSGMKEKKSIVARACLKVPAVLGIGDERYTGDAKSQGQFMSDLISAKYAVRPRDPNLQLLSAIVSDLTDAVPVPADVEIPRVWTLNEALNPKTVSNLLPLPRGTSAGYGFDKGKGKHHYIGYDEEKDLYYPQNGLEEKISQDWDRVRNGLNVLTIFTEFPKDECLPPEKAARRFARSVSASPLDATIMAKQCFGSFINAFHQCNFDWGHAVGLDVMSSDWDSIQKRLHLVGTKGFATDFKKFDSTMSKAFMYMFYIYVDKWYKDNGQWSEDDSRARFTVVHNMCNSLHICGSTVFAKSYGLPSGSLLTTIINCFWAQTLLRYSFACLAPDDCKTGTKNGSIAKYDTYCKSFVLGDDNITGVDDAIENWFNAANIGAFLKAELDITITPPQKDRPLSETNDLIVNLEFLANTTVVDKKLIPGVAYFPRIKLDSLSKCVAYVKPNALMTHQQALETNIDDTLRRVWHSGRTRFESVRRDLVGAYKRLYPGYPEHFQTYELLQLELYPDSTYVEVHCDTFHGITFSNSRSSYNLENVQSSGIEMNQESDMETRANVDAKAGNDNPNVPAQLACVLMQPAPYISSGQQVSFNPSFAITNEIEPPQMDTLNTGDDCDLNHMCRMTAISAREITELLAPGTIVDTRQLCPNHEMIGASLGNVISTSAIGAVSSMFKYWRGSLVYGIQVSRPGVSTGRLGIAVNYNQFTPPTNLDEATSQRYVMLELTGDATTVYVEVPYVAPTRLLETYNGQSDPTLYSMGTISVFVINPYRVPSSGSSLAYVNIFFGAGPSFQLYTPFGHNETLRYAFPGSSDFPVALLEGEKKEPQHIDVFHGLDGAVVRNAMTGYNERIVLDSKGSILNPAPNPIVQTPQNLRVMMRRLFLVGYSDNSNDYRVSEFWGGRIGPACLRSPLRKMSSFFRFWNGSFNITAMTDTKNSWLQFFPSTTGFVNNEGVLARDTSTAQLAGASSTGGAIAYNPNNKGFCSGKIPFVSREHALKLPKADVDITDQYNIGWIRAFNDAYMYVNAGDGLRFSVPYGVPRLIVAALNVTPDTYPAPSPPIVDEFHMMSGTGEPAPEEAAVLHTPEVIGVALAEEQKVEVKETSAIVPSTSAHAQVIGQPQLDFTDYLRRDQLIATFDWSDSGQPEGTQLYTRPVPSGLLLNSALRAAQAFRLGSLDAIITLKCQATAFHAGRIVMYSVPATTLAEVNSNIAGHKPSISFLEHVFLDASASGSVELRVPYRFMRPYISLTGNELLATLKIEVWNELSVGLGGASTAACSVFVRFENINFRVINPL